MTLLPFVKSRHAIQSEVDVGLMADAGGVVVTASGVTGQRLGPTNPLIARVAAAPLSLADEHIARYDAVPQSAARRTRGPPRSSTPRRIRTWRISGRGPSMQCCSASVTPRYRVGRLPGGSR